jgi:hypothetical protein
MEAAPESCRRRTRGHGEEARVKGISNCVAKKATVKKALWKI